MDENIDDDDDNGDDDDDDDNDGNFNGFKFDFWDQCYKTFYGRKLRIFVVS
jgi:hypothetical protein